MRQEISRLQIAEFAVAAGLLSASHSSRAFSLSIFASQDGVLRRQVRPRECDVPIAADEALELRSRVWAPEPAVSTLHRQLGDSARRAARAAIGGHRS